MIVETANAFAALSSEDPDAPDLLEPDDPPTPVRPLPVRDPGVRLVDESLRFHVKPVPLQCRLR